MSEVQEGKTVTTAVAQVLRCLSDNMGALTGDVLSFEARPAMCATPSDVENIIGSGQVGRLECKLEGPKEGPLELFWPLSSLITLVAAYRSDAEDDIREARGASECSEDDLATFEEVAMLLSASFQEAITEHLGESFTVDLAGQSVDDLSKFRSGSTKDLAVPFNVIAGGLPPTRAVFCIPLAFAEELEGGEIAFEESDSFDDLDDFEAAEIVGSLAAFVTRANTVRMLRKACRRVGLTFEKRPKSEVPKPACYANSFVVLEVGTGQARRYEWCQRLKTMARGNQVLFLIDKPTKVSIVRAHTSGADAILSLQSTEREVSAKLLKMIEVRDAEESA